MKAILSSFTALVVSSGALLSSLQAEIVLVEEITNTSPDFAVADEWVRSDVRPGGTAKLVRIEELGGNLAANEPGGTSHLGVAQLTTNLTNAAKAEIGTFQDFGLASDVLTDVDLSYSFYKESVAGGATASAPSLKLFVENTTTSESGYLIYEPYQNSGAWNGGAAIGDPTPGEWYTATINQDTGAGTTASGGWWWSGGFGQGSSFGGPPLRSLVEWNTLFGGNADYADAHINSISLGVGSYNPGQLGYFDAVSITTNSLDKTYNFAAAPEPSSALLLSGILTALGFGTRRRRALND